MNSRNFAMAFTLCLLAACSTTPPPQATTTSASAAPPAPAAAPATSAAPAAGAAVAEKLRLVRSRDGSYNGEVVGTPATGSLLAKVGIGMTGDDVLKVMGRQPNRFHTYESGKRWIPMYFGNDTVRMQALYEGEGCLIYAAGNRFARTTPDLIRIEFDASGKCYQP